MLVRCLGFYNHFFSKPFFRFEAPETGSRLVGYILNSEECSDGQREEMMVARRLTPAVTDPDPSQASRKPGKTTDKQQQANIWTG